MSAYGQFPAGEVATLYEHCCRALRQGITAGPHEIPLMGAHDWNDGMNRVGIHGKGESIWLGWFLSRTLDDFAEMCDLMDDHKRARNFASKQTTFTKHLRRMAGTASMASGICVLTMMTVPDSDRPPTMNAASIPLRNPGRSFPRMPTRTMQPKRWNPFITIWSARKMN